MRVLLIAEYVRRLPWSPSLWAQDLARGLTGRRLDVDVLLDGCDDPSPILALPPAADRTDGPRGAITLTRRRPLRLPRQRHPLRFQRWAIEQARRRAHDVSLSLTPLVPADLWAPIGPPSAAEFAALIRARPPATVAMESAQNPWILAALVGERRARALAARRDPPPRRATIGTPRADDRTVDLGFASRLDPLEPAEHHRARARVRSLLGLDGNRVVLVLSAVHRGRPGLNEMLTALARVGSDARAARASPPALIVAGRDTHSLERLYRAVGASELVHPVGTTASMREILCAADLAVAPFAARHREATGRFVADALRLGVPVIADRDAPGAGLVRPTTFGTGPLGAIVHERTPGAWARAIADASDVTWRRDACEAARAVSDTLSMEGLLDRLTEALRRAARRR